MWSGDSGATVSTAYDAASNRRHTVVKYIQTQDTWYGYDQANRVIYDSSIGTIGYEAGFRVNETNTQGPSRTLNYNIDGTLTDAAYYQLAPDTIRTHRDYTGNNNLYQYTESDSTGTYYIHSIGLLPNGWQNTDSQLMDGVWQSITTYENFTPIGLPQAQHTDYANNIHDQINNSYTPYDDMKLTNVSGSREDKYGWGPITVASRYYDPNGIVTYETGLQDGAEKIFTTTYDGKILSRDNYYGVGYSHSQYFYNTKGQMIASYGVDPNNSNYQLVDNYLQHCLNRIQSAFNSWWAAADHNIFNEWFTKTWVNFELQIANAQGRVSSFEAQSRAPHLSFPDFVMTYPAPVPKKYTVAANDNFVSIAQHMYGDGSFASKISAMNGFSLDSKLEIGEILNLPQYSSITNNAGNATPYDCFVGIIMGSLYPHLKLKQPPPPKHHDSGGFWSGVVHAVMDVVGAVVGVIVAMYAPELLELYVGLFTALADAAYQEVAVAVGWQDHFSFAAALTAGIEAGITAGVMSGGASTVGGIFRNVAAQSLRETIMKAGEIAVADQLAEMATGLRQKFDFMQILAQIGTAVVMQRLAPAEDEALGVNSKTITGEVVDNETQGLVDGGLEATLDHQQFNLENISANALGSAIGQSMGSDMKADGQKKNAQAANAYSQAQQGSVSLKHQAASHDSQNPGDNPNGFFNNRKNANQGNNRYVNQSTTSNMRQQSHVPSLSELLKLDPNISIIARGPSGAELFDRVTGQYFVYDNAIGVRQIDSGSVDSIHPIADVALGGIEGKIAADTIVGGLERFAPNVFRTLESGAENLLQKWGMFGRNGTESSVYHSVTSSGNGQGVLDKINPRFFREDTRFGEAFYVSEKPDTTLAELKYHKAAGVDTIRFNFNQKSANILDLTQPKVANRWGYAGGNEYDDSQAIASKAQEAGYNVIRYQSERGMGANLAILNDFENLLSPQMIVPVSEEIVEPGSKELLSEVLMRPTYPY